MQSKEYNFFANRFSITVDNGCLFKNQQLIFPPAYRKEIIETVHKLHIQIKSINEAILLVANYAGGNRHIQ